MNHTVPVTLPGGYWLDGVCHRQAELRPLTSADEAFLLEMTDPLLPAQRTSALLNRCVTRLGSLESVTLDHVRSLTVGDREALLLHLRRLTFGNEVQCNLSCPGPDCGMKMDLALKISEFLLPPYSDTQERHEVWVAADEVRYRVRFRVPTGADTEAAGLRAVTNPLGAVDTILAQCVENITTEDGCPVEKPPKAVAEALSETMSQCDPQAELMLHLSCPECGNSFSALLDAGSFLFQEISSRCQQLYREVHLLAYHYHWSEAEIMGMMPRKRQRYLSLLSEALA